ncbi:MAG: YbaK/EbsC family protein [Bacilli bacterium]
MGKGDIHYLAILDGNKKDLEFLAKQIGSSHLSFASEAGLYKYLKLTFCSFSPLSLLNYINHEVIILIDYYLINEEFVNFHPNINAVTIDISYMDFEKFVNGIKISFITLESISLH